MKFIDMFCGIGGFRYGLEKVGIQGQQSGKGNKPRLAVGEQEGQPSGRNGAENTFGCVWANDNDRYACQIYRKHFGEVCEGDIRTVDADAIPEHDLLCAGFPCQSFSIAGRRRGFEDTRGTLFFEICRVIRAKRPDYLLLENVKGLLSHDDGATFQTILESLDELGYDLQWQVLNSKDFGVPQNRERVFIIGHTRGKPRPKVFPIGEDGEGVVDTLGEEQGGEEGIRGDFASIDSRTGSTARGQHFIAGSLTGGGHSGGLHSDMTVIPVLTPDREKKRQHGRRFKESGEPMFTLTGQDIHGIEIANAVDVDGYLRTGARPRDKNGKPQLLPIGYRRIRRLTPLECERLQGFPDGWTEGISDTQRYKCLGNAVTVNVIEAIGKRLLDD